MRLPSINAKVEIHPLSLLIGFAAAVLGMAALGSSAQQQAAASQEVAFDRVRVRSLEVVGDTSTEAGETLISIGQGGIRLAQGDIILDTGSAKFTQGGEITIDGEEGRTTISKEGLFVFGYSKGERDPRDWASIRSGSIMAVRRAASDEDGQRAASLGASWLCLGNERFLASGPPDAYVYLGQAESGAGFLHLRSESGAERVSLGELVTGDGGTIRVHNETGQPVVTLLTDEKGNGEVGAWDRNGKGRTLKPGP